jgi:hypothetical protein
MLMDVDDLVHVWTISGVVVEQYKKVFTGWDRTFDVNANGLPWLFGHFGHLEWCGRLLWRSDDLASVMI